MVIQSNVGYIKCIKRHNVFDRLSDWLNTGVSRRKSCIVELKKKKAGSNPGLDASKDDSAELTGKARCSYGFGHPMVNLEMIHFSGSSGVRLTVYEFE